MADKKPKEKKTTAKKPKAASKHDENSSDELENLTPEPKFTEDFDSEDGESEIDGCDFTLTENDAELITLDEDLPKTEGGVA